MMVNWRIVVALAAAPVVLGSSLTSVASVMPEASSAAPVIDWSREAQRAIVPPGPGGVFGQENYGNKFPGEAAVYMGIVHAAIYDAAVAIEGGYQRYAITIDASSDTSPAAAIATAVHHTLIGSRT
jgi:hypothetical protein